MQKRAERLLILLSIVFVLLPSFALAAWWNPMSWGIWNKIFKGSEICVLGRTCGNDGKWHHQKSVNGRCVDEVGDSCGDITSDWKTYKNDVYGFELKYPRFYKITGPGTNPQELQVTFGDLDSEYIGDISINVSKNTANESPADYFKRLKSKASADFASKCSTCANLDKVAKTYDCLADNPSVLKIPAHDGFFCKGDSEKGINVLYIFNGDYIYKFLNFSESNPDYRTYAQMMLTLKFTKVGETNAASDDWKTYEDKAYGFEIKYPNGCTLDTKAEDEPYFDYYLGRKLRIDCGKTKWTGRGDITVYFNSENKNVAKCATGQEHAVPPGKKDVNGLQFNYWGFGDAAMGGQRGKANIYTLVRGNTCIFIRSQIVYTDVTFNAGATGVPYSESDKKSQDKDVKNRDDLLNKIIFTN